MAFCWNGEKQDNWDIWRKQIGPGQPLRLTADPAEDKMPTWSPDGHFIAFLRLLGRTRYEVRLVPALGGAERRLGEIYYWDIELTKLAWSPDSRWLVVPDQPEADKIPGLFLLSVDTGEKRRLTSPSKGVDFDPSFSPDGQALAFVRYLDFNISHIYRTLLTADLTSKAEPERLTFEDQLVRSPVWTKDGKDILYSSGHFMSGERFVQRIRNVGQKSRTEYSITQELFGETATCLAISPNGRLAYDRNSWDSNIYRIELSGKTGSLGPPKKHISSTRHEHSPEYSPNGQTIAFTSTRSGTEEIWLCNADGSNLRKLTSMGGPQTANARWSPDGKTVVFDSRKEGSADLYLIGADGGSPRHLTSNPGYEGEARWSGDGNWIYFERSVQTGRDDVFKIQRSGGEIIQVTKNGGIDGFESPDRKWLYYSKDVNDITTIWKVPLGGGEETQVHPGPLSYTYNFVVVEDGIYLTTANRTLEFFDFASRKSKTLIKIDRDWSLGLTISPDHRWILCSQLEQLNSDLMLVENFR